MAAQSVKRQTTGWTVGIQFPWGEGYFPLLHSVKTGSRAHPASYPHMWKSVYSFTDYTSPNLMGLVNSFNCIALFVSVKYIWTMSSWSWSRKQVYKTSISARLISQEDSIWFGRREHFSFYAILLCHVAMNVTDCLWGGSTYVVYLRPSSGAIDLTVPYFC
jgi:hypothetical protein